MVSKPFLITIIHDNNNNQRLVDLTTVVTNFSFIILLLYRVANF